MLKIFILTETEAKSPEYAHCEPFTSLSEAQQRLRELYHGNAVLGNPDAIEKASLSENKASVFFLDGNSIHWNIQETEIKTVFSPKELRTLSDIFHDYKDGHRGNKMSVRPAMALEAKLKEMTDGRYQPDTAYDVEDFTEEDLDELLQEACEDYAKEYNEDHEDDEFFMETNANGFYVNVKEKKIEFEFTVMNEKFWKDISFDAFYADYGIDLNNYKHLFTE